MSIKSSQKLVEEANKIIETLSANEVKKLVEKKEITLIDVRDNQPVLLECMTTRWRDHVGPGDDRHIKFRSDKELDDAIKNDDLKKLENLLPKNEVDEIKKQVDLEIKDAIKYSENSKFPDKSEINPNEKAIRIPLNLPNINVEYKTNIRRKSGEI